MATVVGLVQEFQGAVQHFRLQRQIGKQPPLCCPQSDLRQLVIIDISPAHDRGLSAMSLLTANCHLFMPARRAVIACPAVHISVE